MHTAGIVYKVVCNAGTTGRAVVRQWDKNDENMKTFGIVLRLVALFGIRRILCIDACPNQDIALSSGLEAGGIFNDICP